MTFDVTCNLFLNQRLRLNYRPEKKYDFSIAKNLLMRFQVLDSKKTPRISWQFAHILYICAVVFCFFQHVSR